jgi:hypothetical protein
MSESRVIRRAEEQVGVICDFIVNTSITYRDHRHVNHTTSPPVGGIVPYVHTAYIF